MTREFVRVIVGILNKIFNVSGAAGKMASSPVGLVLSILAVAVLMANGFFDTMFVVNPTILQF